MIKLCHSGVATESTDLTSSMVNGRRTTWRRNLIHGFKSNKSPRSNINYRKAQSLALAEYPGATCPSKAVERPGCSSCQRGQQTNEYKVDSVSCGDLQELARQISESADYSD